MLPWAQDGDGNTLGGESRGASQKNRDQKTSRGVGWGQGKASSEWAVGPERRVLSEG